MAVPQDVSTQIESNILTGLPGKNDLFGIKETDWITDDGTDVLAFGEGLITLRDNAVLSFSIDEFSSSQSHAIGMFQVDPESQGIVHVDFIWESTTHYDPPPDVGVIGVAGQSMGFFVLSDGFVENDFDSLPPGYFAFAEEVRGVLSVVHIDYDDSQVRHLAGQVLVSTQTNATTGHLIDASDALRIGFDENWGQDGIDLSDLTFVVDLGTATATALAIDSVAFAKGGQGSGQSNLLSAGHDDDGSTEWTLSDGAWQIDPKDILPKSEDVLVFGDEDNDVDISKSDSAGPNLAEVWDDLNGGDVLVFADPKSTPDSPKVFVEQIDQSEGMAAEEDSEVTIDNGAVIATLWGSREMAADTTDIFVYSDTSNDDNIRDFETGLDKVDLSTYGLSFADVQTRFVDLGWATEIDLSDLAAEGVADRILLRSVNSTELQEDNFIL
ncbi:MAG: M10 family metallopeptidase C-terminal domain-containing protein [Planktomarina sp.]